MRADSATSVKMPNTMRQRNADVSCRDAVPNSKLSLRQFSPSTVTAETADGKTTDYHIVGAWDGDPDKNLVSYKTKFGEALLGAKVGDTVQLPHGDSIRIKKISALPEALAKELSPED